MNRRERRVIDTCLAEHAAQQRLLTTIRALTAPKGSPAIDHHRRAQEAALAATHLRQAAVRDLAAFRRGQPQKETP